MPDPDDRIRTLLAADPPSSVLALDEARRAALADVLEDARRRQSEGLEAAFMATLRFIPFPLRKIVRKVLLG